jgi:hypothetical protein
MEWIAWAAFTVFVGSSGALASFLAVWMGRSALGHDWRLTSGALWLGSLPFAWGGAIVAFRSFRWLQPDPRHAEGFGLFLAGIIAFNPDWLGVPLAYAAFAVYWLLTRVLPVTVFLLAVVPFLLNAGPLRRQHSLLPGFGRWLLAATLVGLVLIPVAVSLAVGPKVSVFQIFRYAVSGGAGSY